MAIEFLLEKPLSTSTTFPAFILRCAFTWKKNEKLEYMFKIETKKAETSIFCIFIQNEDHIHQQIENTTIYLKYKKKQANIHILVLGHQGQANIRPILWVRYFQVLRMLLLLDIFCTQSQVLQNNLKFYWIRVVSFKRFGQ